MSDYEGGNNKGEDKMECEKSSQGGVPNGEITSNSLD